MFILCSVSMQVISCQSSRSRCRLLNCLTYKYFTGWSCADFLVKERNASRLVLVCSKGESYLCVEDKTSLFSFGSFCFCVAEDYILICLFSLRKRFVLFSWLFRTTLKLINQKRFVDFKKTKVELETADQL